MCCSVGGVGLRCLAVSSVCALLHQTTTSSWVEKVVKEAVSYAYKVCVCSCWVLIGPCRQWCSEACCGVIRGGFQSYVDTDI